MAKTPSQLIDAKGGSAAFAAAIGHSYGAVRTMKSRNRLPRTVWPKVMKAYADLTLDALIRVERAGAPAKERRLKEAA